MFGKTGDFIDNKIVNKTTKNLSENNSETSSQIKKSLEIPKKDIYL